MVLSGLSMLFKILTYSGRYAAEELEAGASLVRGSRGRMENDKLSVQYPSLLLLCLQQ
jgi:hypothetical protein